MSVDFKELFKLMRPQQWFKSFTILFGASVVLYKEGLTTLPLIPLILAFLGVSLLSSTIYVLNDIADAEKDRLHPVKKNRPIASKKVSVNQGLILAVLLLTTSLVIFYYLKPILLGVGVLMLVNNVLYSFKPFRFKDIPIIDVLSAALNFCIRVVIGWYAISDYHMYRIVILFPFFIAGFLLSCKRLGEYQYLGNKAVKVRSVYKYYDRKSLYTSINAYFTLSILAYYFFAEIFNKTLFFLGPWFFLQIYWYKSFLKDKNSVVKKPEDVFLKKKLFTISGLLFCAAFLFIILFA